jgi:hypothetical protein
MRTSTVTIMVVYIFICSFFGFSHADLTTDLECATGNRTKIVFAKCLAGKGESDLISPNYSLNGFDSYRGEFFEIVSGPRCCSNPIITPDGNSVVFSDRTRNEVFIASWCGTPARALVSGYGLCVQQDTAATIDWIYVSDSAYGSRIYRYDLSNMNRRELIWDKTKVSIRFTVSADGRFGGGEFPWPTVGEVSLPNSEFQQFGTGCNAGIAPDNSYRLFHMDGKHRSLWVYDSGGINTREIRLDNAPGVDSNTVWIPRWSSDSDARFLTMTAPCQDTPFIHKEDICFGSFNGTYDSITNWIRVTNTADTFENYAYAWIGRQRYVRLDRYDIDFIRRDSGIDTLHRCVTASSLTGPLQSCSASSQADWLLVQAVSRNGKIIVDNAIDTTHTILPGLYSTVVTPHFSDYADESYRVNLKMDGASVPTSLTIVPREAHLRQFDSLPFKAICLDQFHNPLTIECDWSLTGGGTLNASGMFKSNGDDGVFVIRAWLLSFSTLRDSTTIRVFENPRIILPDENTLHHAGDSLIICWISHLPEFINLMVYLSCNSGRNWQLLNPIKAIYPDFKTTGRFSWLIPNSFCNRNAQSNITDTSSSCMIKITDYLNEIKTVSDKPFRIICGDSQCVRKNVVDAHKMLLRYAFLRAVSPEEMVSLAAFTLAGRLVGSFKGKAEQIRIRSLPKGIYLFKITTAPRKWCEKFMVW